MSFRRTAIVTGAAQGIGRAIALRLARDGLNIAVSDLSSKTSALEGVADDIRAKGGNALAVPADVSVENDVKNLVSAATDKFGGLDVMIANAGIATSKPFVETTLADFDNILSVNARGVFMCYQAVAKVMIEQNRGGRIIGACSIAGKRGLPTLSAYSASKFAVRALTQVAALELGQYGITVNGYAPGAINTSMLHSFLSATDVGKELAAQSALHRLAQPEEVANIVSFLASSESSFMTGQTVTVDGGIWFD